MPVGKSVLLFTDGACRSTGLGGWACVAIENNVEVGRVSGQAHDTTNNRMEIMGILMGLSWAVNNGYSDNVIVITDSKYCINAIKAWTIKTGISSEHFTKNSDLLRQVSNVIRMFKHPPKFSWIKGHSGNAGNELADKLATAARDAKPLV